MIWQVHVYEAQNGSVGFHYFGSKREALEFCRQECHGFPVVEDGPIPNDCCVLEARKTPKNKRDMVRMLWVWGSHPDNG